MAKSGAKPSPFAPARLPDMPVVPGVRLAACEAGIRYQNRTDLMAAVLDPGTVAAGVLTQSKTCSAPVLWCRSNLAHGKAQALVVNSGNANAFTGKKGSEATRLTAEAAAKSVGCAANEVYIASTGVIGEPLDAGKFTHLLQGLTQGAIPDAFLTAARAIMTTDTYTKLATRTAKIGEVAVTINGFCKGAGMIAPDMATMLCFMFTDAAIAQPALQALLSQHVATTFNCMTVDGDTSTSDTCLLFATGAAAKRGQQVVDRARRRAARRLQRGPARPDARPRHPGSQGRRGSVQVRDLRDRRRGKLGGGAQDRASLRQLADPESCHRRRGPELGPRGDGGRQIGRGGRS